MTNAYKSIGCDYQTLSGDLRVLSKCLEGFKWDVYAFMLMHLVSKWFHTGPGHARIPWEVRQSRGTRAGPTCSTAAWV